MPIQADAVDLALPVHWRRPLEGEGGSAGTGVLVGKITSGAA